jgi:hypothetical protein
MTGDPDRSIGRCFLENALATLRSQKELAERAIVQLDDDRLRQPLDAHTNSIAVIMKHVAGNALSRWTEFLDSDGEKPWRHRDGEFIDDFVSRASVMDYWEKGWQCCFDGIGALEETDLTREVMIRGEPHTVIQAIHRQISHYGYHVGQIVQLARHLAGDSWEPLTISRGGSEAFNRVMEDKRRRS